MNYVKELFKKNLPPEYIELTAMEERADDTRWMIQKGYKTDFHRDSRGFMQGGDLTRSGKKFLDEYEKRFDVLFKKIEKMSPDIESSVRERLRQYIKKHPDVDYREGLSDDEKRVCNYLLKAY